MYLRHEQTCRKLQSSSVVVGHSLEPLHRARWHFRGALFQPLRKLCSFQGEHFPAAKLCGEGACKWERVNYQNNFFLFLMASVGPNLPLPGIECRETTGNIVCPDLLQNRN